MPSDEWRIRSEMQVHGTITGRFPREPEVQDINKVGKPKPVLVILDDIIDLDYSKLERRVVAHWFSEDFKGRDIQVGTYNAFKAGTGVMQFPLRELEPLQMYKVLYIPADKKEHKPGTPVLHCGKHGAMPIPSMRRRKLKKWKRHK